MRERERLPFECRPWVCVNVSADARRMVPRDQPATPTSFRAQAPFAVKLTNVKRDGSAFPCFLALKPVFGKAGEYLYQVGG